MKRLKESSLEKECVNWDEIKNLPKTEIDIWPVYEGRPVKAVLIDGKYRLIDLEISGLIESLNKAGRKTLYCCAGHKEDYRECRAYISFENTRENREFISRIALRRIENEIPIDKINSELLIESPCVIRLRYGKGHRDEILENFIKLFYDEAGNIVS